MLMGEIDFSSLVLFSVVPENSVLHIGSDSSPQTLTRGNDKFRMTFGYGRHTTLVVKKKERNVVIKSMISQYE